MLFQNVINVQILIEYLATEFNDWDIPVGIPFDKPVRRIVQVDIDKFITGKILTNQMF